MAGAVPLVRRQPQPAAASEWKRHASSAFIYSLCQSFSTNSTQTVLAFLKLLTIMNLCSPFSPLPLPLLLHEYQQISGVVDVFFFRLLCKLQL